MSLLKPNRSAQYPLVQEFIFNFNDTAVDTVAGTTKTFGSTFGDNIVFDALPLPPNAVVVGGDITVDTAFVGPTVATLAVGDSASATRYLAATSLLSAARTALTLTGYRGLGENVRLTMNVTVANATAGKVSVRLHYVVTGRAQEVQIA